jgi:hypothetical protein
VVPSFPTKRKWGSLSGDGFLAKLGQPPRFFYDTISCDSGLRRLRSLISEIAHSIAAPAVTKRFLFFAPGIPFQRYLGCYQEAFEIGVVLGYTFRNKLLTFAKLFAEANHEQELITFMQELARQRLSETQEPETFFQLGMLPEESRIKTNWRKSGTDGVSIDFLQKRHRLPLAQACKNLYVSVSAGIGFGSAFPELTERMWKVEHEYPMSREGWEKRRSDGAYRMEEMFGRLTAEQVKDFQTAEPPESVTLAKRQGQLLSQVESFISGARPELLHEFKGAIK